MMRSVLLLGICVVLTGAWKAGPGTVELGTTSALDRGVALGDTLSASEARRLDSLAAVTCVQNWYEREGFVRMPSRRSRLGEREVLRFGRWNDPGLMEVWEASVGVYPDSVRVWEYDGPIGGRLTRKESTRPFRVSAVCRRARTQQEAPHPG